MIILNPITVAGKRCTDWNGRGSGARAEPVGTVWANLWRGVSSQIKWGAHEIRGNECCRNKRTCPLYRHKFI